MKQPLTITTTVLLLLGLASATQAALFTWTGTGSGQLWSTATNWSGGVAPVASTTTDQISVNGVYTSSADSAWTIKSLNVGNGATLKGGALTLTGSLNSDWGGTIENNLILGSGAGRINHGYGGTLTIKGNVTSSNIGLDFRGGKATAISGVVSLGTAGVFITNNGTSVTLSNAANSYSGNNAIATGTLSANSIANAGTACAIGSGSTITLAQPGGYTGTLQFTGTNGGSSNRTLSLVSTGTGDTGIIENTVAGKTLALSGNFQYDDTSRSAGAWKFIGSGNGLVSGNITTTGARLTKEGTGTWTLTGNNTYGGATTVSTGTLLVSNTLGSGTGAGSVTVASGATLGGIGIIDPGTGNSVTINGILAPGESGLGILTVGSLGSLNNATLNGTYAADIGDLVKVYGQLALGGSSILTLGGSPTPGTNYTLASYTGGLTGTFATINNLPGGWQVTYGSDAITLGLIPEPASLLLLAAGGLLMGARRRAGPH